MESERDQRAQKLKRERGFIESRWEGAQEWTPFKDNEQSISEGVGQGPWYLGSKYREPLSSKQGTGYGNLTPSKNVVISARHPGLQNSV